MPWEWKINLMCHFCQPEETYDFLKDAKPCGTCLVDIEGQLTAVLICEECYNKRVKK